MITLKTLWKATKQQVFDQVLAHARTQEVKAGTSDETGQFLCKYRDDAGRKCFVGALIGNDEYSPELEGNGWSTLIFEKGLPTTHQDLIKDLQNIHDFYDPDRWEEKFENVANEFKLQYTPPN